MAVIARTIILQDEKRRAHALKVIGSLPLDELYAVTIAPYAKKRSLEANRRLWALHQLAANATGHTPEEMHEWAKWQFLPHTTVKVGDVEREIAASSTALSTKTFAEFMEKTEAFYISTLGVWLDQ